MQNKKKKESETGDDDGEDDEDEMPEDTGDRLYDTSERDGRSEPIRTSPAEDVTQIDTDGEIPQGEKIGKTIRRSSRKINKPIRYGSVWKFFGVTKSEMFAILQVQTGTQERERHCRKPPINQQTSYPEKQLQFHNKKINGDKILIAVNRFSKWPLFKYVISENAIYKIQIENKKHLTCE